MILPNDVLSRMVCSNFEPLGEPIRKTSVYVIKSEYSIHWKHQQAKSFTKRLIIRLLGAPTGEILYKNTHVIYYLVYSPGSTPDVMKGCWERKQVKLGSENRKKSTSMITKKNQVLTWLFDF